MTTVAVASGQSSRVDGVRIAGLVSCVPPRQIGNEEFAERFGDAVGEITKMTGVLSRHWVEEGVTTSDLCVRAAKRLLDRLAWSPDSVDGIIFISQTPDYRLPATALIVHAALGLRPGVIAFDVNLGCSAYPYGLWLAMTMVASGAAKRILLAVGDTSSKVVDPNDRATALLFGDAGTVTALEASVETPPAYFILGGDGRGAENLIIPQGGFRRREHRSQNDPEKLFMDGGEIFTFTLKAVPPLVADTMVVADASVADYDAFLFHQANTFMINHISKKAKLPRDKVPMNIDRYGNTSSATLPLLLTDQLGERLAAGQCMVGLFGFGVGYSWASASLTLGPLDCAETVTL